VRFGGRCYESEERRGTMLVRRVQGATVLLSIVTALLLGITDTSEGGLKYERTVEEYSIPDVTLVNQEGEVVRLREILNSDAPVFLDFIYATCTTICPVLSVGFSNFQKKMGPETQRVRMVSISIDPDNDKPEVMKKYLERYKARPGWDFLTGTREDIFAVMRAFDAYVPNKMSHYPITFLRAPGQEKWVRIYGLLSTKELTMEYEELIEK
jgi:protein SCO1/2